MAWMTTLRSHRSLNRQEKSLCPCGRIFLGSLKWPIDLSMPLPLPYPAPLDDILATIRLRSMWRAAVWPYSSLGSWLWSRIPFSQALHFAAVEDWPEELMKGTPTVEGGVQAYLDPSSSARREAERARVTRRSVVRTHHHHGASSQ